MELFKLYSKEKADFFCLIKLLFIKVRCLINVNVSYEANLKVRGCKQHCLPFVGSNLEVEVFLKKREHQKTMRWNRQLRHLFLLCIEVSRRFYAKPIWFLIVFGYKRNSKSFIFFHSLIIEFLWFVYGSNSRKRYTLRLLSKCLVRSTLLPIGGKVPPTLRYPLWFP